MTTFSSIALLLAAIDAYEMLIRCCVTATATLIAVSFDPDMPFLLSKGVGRRLLHELLAFSSLSFSDPRMAESYDLR
ncbi:hypothetical protein EHS39_34475 [Ensifer sp. MPMI2T]|nr:hypothetical protein EHS39_34475 [Ensifer sp. MPMI2T]